MGKTQTEFGHYLSAIVGSQRTGKPISVQALNDALARVEGNATRDSRKNLYQYMRGTHVPNPQRAWNIGVALRAHGLPWCNGLISLFFAEHYSEFIGTVARVSLDPARRYRMLLRQLLTTLCGSWLVNGANRLSFYERLAAVRVPENASEDWLDFCGASLDDDAFAKLTAEFDCAWMSWREERTIASPDLYLLSKVCDDKAVPIGQRHFHMRPILEQWLRRRFYNDPSEIRF